MGMGLRSTMLRRTCDSMGMGVRSTMYDYYYYYYY